MRDYTHRDWKDKPKWYRMLINAKWKFIQADRKTHGKLTLMIMLSAFLIVYLIISNRPYEYSPETLRAEKLAKCLFNGGCLWDV